MVTGVSKFARTSLFSGANQLNDISVDPEFSSLLGYTKSEIRAAFAPHLDVLAKNEEMTQDKLWHGEKNYTMRRHSSTPGRDGDDNEGSYPEWSADGRSWSVGRGKYIRSPI